MFKTIEEAIAFAEEFKTLYKDTDVQAGICAPIRSYLYWRKLFRNRD